MSELQGKGTTTIAVGERNGQVVLQFPTEIQWCALDPETARQVGEAIARGAYEVRYGKAPSRGSTLSLEIRGKLITRVQHIMRNLQELQRPPQYIASEIVDQILREVL